ncbi:MAG: hypothetical protein R3189_04495 [Thiomicrorhabdus chilensis]|uniref:hypothetical protein n=1 Tax=Thiomicrorhabdus chilensis TaxID=63656 RepID=UPI00299EC07B|nr:hypothetical protein [Thiomicrorhabdus chilensis]MDX1347494.1 hypothetical protein [Thiomicrorhabdus chilensis]
MISDDFIGCLGFDDAPWPFSDEYSKAKWSESSHAVSKSDASFIFFAFLVQEFGFCTLIAKLIKITEHHIEKFIARKGSKSTSINDFHLYSVAASYVNSPSWRIKIN